jgi:hypothetical protein
LIADHFSGHRFPASTLPKFPAIAFFWTLRRARSVVELVAWSADMEDFESKLEKYMARAAKCEEQAKEATDPTRADFYEVLGRYFRNLANDFKTIIEKRKTA